MDKQALSYAFMRSFPEIQANSSEAANSSGPSEITERSLLGIQANSEAERGPLTSRSSQTVSSGKFKLFLMLSFLNQSYM